MKISRRPNMVKWLETAERKAKRILKKQGPPGEGYMSSLLYGDLDKNKRGHYQVELIHDSRMYDEPTVVVYWWPERWRRPGSSSADYFLTRKELENGRKHVRRTP